ncbi:MAG: hypothetical protein RR297_06660 [Clostridia bacterium]
MKKKFVCFLVTMLIVCSTACDNKQSSTTAVDAATASPVATVIPESTPAPESTPEPTPIPIPVLEVNLNSTMLSRQNGITITGTSLSYAINSALSATLGVENGSTKDITLRLSALTVNNWKVGGTLDEDCTIAAGETGKAIILVSDVDKPLFAAMQIDEIVTMSCTFSIYQAGTDKLMQEQVVTLTNPEADATDSFIPGTTVLLDNQNLKIILQAADENLRNVQLYMEKKPSAYWTTCCIAPICGGYTGYLNPIVSMNKGARILVLLDNSAIFERHGIEALSTMDLYITLKTSSKIDNSIQLTIENPAQTEEQIQVAEDVSPIVFQDKYSILRYKGIDNTIFGKDVILIDLENVTQTYIKTMEIVAYPAHATIQLDGVTYSLDSYCTYSYPCTHGWLMLWPTDAPEGALQNATSASVKLKLSRFRSGHLDPVTDTGWFDITLR